MATVTDTAAPPLAPVALAERIQVLDEAWEPVEKGQMTLGDFRDFVFTNPVKLWTALDPDFFAGTRVEGAVARELAPAPARA
mgnify:CR=1 FL=1